MKLSVRGSAPLHVSNLYAVRTPRLGSLIGAVLFEQNDEWQSQHRNMQVEAFAQIDAAQINPLLSLTSQAA